MTIPRKTSYQQYMDDKYADSALADLRWWFNILEAAVVVLAMLFISALMGLHVEKHGGLLRVKQAYERGLAEGTALPRPASAPQLVVTAPAGRRGPLDLTKFTPAQIQGLRCYLQDRPVIKGLP